MTDSDALLVPVELDALTVGRTFDGILRRQRMDPGAGYRFAAPGSVPSSTDTFASPEPTPFTPNASLADPATWGVYLMWTLPPGLRNATQPSASKATQPSANNATQPSAHSADLEFPLVPNRWLVLRRLTEGSTVSTTSWMVESDFLGLHEGTNPYIDPSSTSLVEGAVTNIGRKLLVTPQNPWSETSTRRAFLQAIGPGDPTFAAFQPSNENVFSLHDQLEGIDAGTLDYMVVGWYANGQGDPLGAATAGSSPDVFQEILDGLRWDDRHGPGLGTDGTRLPRTRTASRSVYHSALFGVEWDRTGAPPPSPRESARPRLAVGHTAADALAGFLRSTGVDPSATTLLEALLADELETLAVPEGEQLLQRRLRDASFGASAGGVTWTVEDRQDARGAKPAAATTPEQLAAEAAWLAELNRAQAELDDKRRLLASLRRDLYEMWWKGRYASALGIEPYGLPVQRFKDAVNPQGVDSLARRVVDLAHAVDDAQAQLPAATPDAPGLAPDVYARNQHLTDTRRLVAGLAPRFYAPHDPVVLVAGLAHDMVMEPTTTQRCRYPDEVVTATAMQQGTSRSTRSVSQLVLPALPLHGSPAEVTALVGEFELLAGAAALDTEGFGSRLTAARALADPSAFAAAGSGDVVLGRVPDIPLRRWQQPWQPLYLEWQVLWHPVPYLGADGSSPWRYDSGDYHLGDHVVSPADVEVPTFSGRALLTPGLAFTVRQKVEAFVRAHAKDADLAHLQEQLDAITQWDFLTQTLDGLNTQLGWRDSRAAPAPDDTVRQLLDGQHRDAPTSRQVSAPHHQLPPEPSVFDGMRAGQLALTRLAVVDRFGRVLDVDADTLRSAAVGTGLEPVRVLDPALQAELAPRVLQGARLRFQLIPSGGARPNPAGGDVSQDVLCGFVVPHHLERALVVYDGAGQLLGELHPTAGQQPALHWSPAVAGVVPTLESLRDAHPELGDMVSGLQEAGLPGFDNVLGAIDEALWTIDPLSAHEDEYLTALVGRPLAVVRAELRLELDGSPLGDPSWPYSFDEEPRTLLTGYPFAIRLGTPADREDGLVGYFTGSYDTLRVVRPLDPADAEPDPRDYVVTASPGDLTVSCHADAVARATLLVDPRGHVQAHTGLLPTTVLALPQEALKRATDAMRVTFRAGPLLGDDPDAAPAMPTPRATQRTWAWVSAPQAATPSQPLPFGVVDDRARFAARPAVALDGDVTINPPEGT